MVTMLNLEKTKKSHHKFSVKVYYLCNWAGNYRVFKVVMIITTVRV